MFDEHKQANLLARLLFQISVDYRLLRVSL